MKKTLVTLVWTSMLAAMGCGQSETTRDEATEDGREQSLEAGECMVLFTTGTAAMRAWHEVLVGGAVDEPFHVPGVIEGVINYDPWVNLSFNADVAFTPGNEVTDVSIDGRTSKRLFDAMTAVKESIVASGGETTTTRASSDGLVSCTRTDSSTTRASYSCSWKGVEGVFAVGRRKGTRCP